MQQGSPEWFEARRGKVTGSMISAVLASKSSEEATTRRNYKMQLACERLTGVVHPTFQSWAMREGKEMEYIGRGTYEGETGRLVKEVGFVDHPSISNCGVSPDGVVSDDGLLEVKCPIPFTHYEFLSTGRIIRAYQYQMTLQMMCTGRKWVDFVSYNDKMPDGLKYKCVRYKFEPAKAKEVADGVIKFLAEVQLLVEEMQTMMKGKMK